MKTFFDDLFQDLGAIAKLASENVHRLAVVKLSGWRFNTTTDMPG